MIRGLRRLYLIAFCWMTAAYAWLAASAFSYQEFIRPKMFGTGVFGAWHAAFFWAWLACAALELRDGTWKRSARIFLAFWAAVGAALTIVPVLPRLRDDAFAVATGMFALGPLVWLSAIAHVERLPYLRSQQLTAAEADRDADEGRWFFVSLGTALFAAVVSAALTPIAMRDAFEPDLLTLGLSVGLLWNAAYHAAIFCGAFLALMVVLRATARFGFGTQYAFVTAIFAALLTVVVRRTVCDALGFDAPTGAAVSIAAAVAIAASWTALRLERWSDRGARLASALDLLTGPPPAALDPRRLAVSLALLAAFVYGVAAASRVIDWDFLMLTVGVVVFWIAAFDCLARATPRLKVGTTAIAIGCAVPLAAWTADAAIQKRMPEWLGDSVFSARRVLDRYAVYNAPFRVADAVMRPAAPPASLFDRFVRAHSGLASQVAIEPVTQTFVTPLGEAPAQPPPNIFVFVIDSLRPDYLTPYNPAVTFSPRIAEFARESVVFRNAFTKFGGTGLSLPSIWAGAVGVHKQYVRPFWPMNTLEKLLEVNRYQRVMSVDVIMEGLLRPNPSTIELDRGNRTMDYEFCRTEDELQAKFPASDSPPVFGYSLPQDLHISNIMTASVPAGESYPGFHAPYAARVRKVDRCFGQFVDFLKRRNLYDRSIVVLAADHGEMLGEDGRWGHAYFMFPPILTVPLVVHLPAPLRAQTVDPGTISFLTDVSPTLYASLGYRVTPSNPLMGEPLLGPDALNPEVRRRGVFVLAASYSAVYAVVRRNGHRVYIADAVKGEDYVYDRDASGIWRARDVSAGRRAVEQRVIREHLDQIWRVYRVSK